MLRAEETVNRDLALGDRGRVKRRAHVAADRRLPEGAGKRAGELLTMGVNTGHRTLRQCRRVGRGGEAFVAVAAGRDQQQQRQKCLAHGILPWSETPRSEGPPDALVPEKRESGRKKKRDSGLESPASRVSRPAFSIPAGPAGGRRAAMR